MPTQEEYVRLARPGSVFGFGFSFLNNKFSQTHPGFVVGVSSLGQMKKCLALPISHAEPAPNEPHIFIPLQDRRHIGLDHRVQYIYFYPTIFAVPPQLEYLVDLNTTYVGQSDPEFLKEVRDGFLQFARASNIKPLYPNWEDWYFN